MIEFREADFSLDEALVKLKPHQSGAVVFFVGVVREGVKELRKIYAETTHKELEELEDEARKRFGVERIFIISRRGSLKVGENILLIGVSSAHRQNAFRAAEFLIDEIRQVASIKIEEVR